MGSVLSKESCRMFENMLARPFWLVDNGAVDMEALLTVDLSRGCVCDPTTGHELGKTIKPTWLDDNAGVRCEIHYATGALGMLWLYPVTQAARQKGWIARFSINVLGLKARGLACYPRKPKVNA